MYIYKKMLRKKIHKYLHISKKSTTFAANYDFCVYDLCKVLPNFAGY